MDDAVVLNEIQAEMTQVINTITTAVKIGTELASIAG
jgi:hypothetical protein